MIENVINDHKKALNESIGINKKQSNKIDELEKKLKIKIKEVLEITKEVNDKSLALDLERVTLEDFLEHSHQKKIEKDAILSNLEQGYLTFNSKGIISEGATKKTERLLQTNLFESEVEEIKIWDILTKHIADKKKKDQMEKFGGQFLFKDLVKMIPSYFIGTHNKLIHLDFRPIHDRKLKLKVVKIIMIVSDKTKEKDLKNLYEKDKEHINFIKNCLQNPVDFIDLIHDTYETLDNNQDIKKNREISFRQFHTLKARFGQFNLSSLVNIITNIEQHIQNSSLKLFQNDISNFRNQFEKLIKDNHLIVEAANKFLVDHGNAIEASKVIEYIINSKSLEELHFNIYNNHILVDLHTIWIIDIFYFY